MQCTPWLPDWPCVATAVLKTALESITEQVEQIDTQIQKAQGKMKDPEAKKKELLDLKKKQELENLYTQIKASGKSVADVISILKNK